MRPAHLQHIEINVRDDDRPGDLLSVTFRHPYGYAGLEAACDFYPWLAIQCYSGGSTPGFTYHACMQ